ncbi:MAG: UDP-N-acetylmuramate--L-alanine ligase [Planctomycetota bacterium]
MQELTAGESSSRARLPSFSLRDGEPLHLVGAAGAGVGGLMRLLRELGHQVTACDGKGGAWMEEALALGVPAFAQHDVHHIPEECRLLVRSAAVPDDRPEIASARARGVRVIKYAELLGCLVNRRRGVAVAGTHGKTTTTAWTAYILSRGHLAPSYVVGGVPHDLAGRAHAGEGPFFVVEACEYDDSFLNFHPAHAAILNVEMDHLDYFGTPERLLQSFRAFAAQVGEGGVLVLGEEVPREVEEHVGAGVRIIRVGWSAACDVIARDLEVRAGCYTFHLSIEGESLGRVQLRLAGRHNVENALAAAALARHCGVGASEIIDSLERFSGVGRRLDPVGLAGGITLLEDYAHHPTAVRVVADALRGVHPSRRLVALFQPHQISRTRYFLKEFAGALARFDRVLVADIYDARDFALRLDPVRSQDLVEEVLRAGGSARVVGRGTEVVDATCAELREGDVCVVMGAGDINEVTPLIRRRLLSEREAWPSPVCHAVA